MDAFKIIKKHGVPAGVPVITAYVDPNAPGEGGNKLYQHNIAITTPTHTNVLTIVTNDATPWTLNTLKQFLSDNGFTSTSNPLRLDPVILIVPPNKLRDYRLMYYSSNQAYVRYMQYTFSIADNAVVISQAGIYTNEQLSTIQDDVFEI